MKQFLWKIGGEAGFGILTTGTVFSKIANRAGYFIFDYIQYPSLIRGGHNTYDVGFSTERIYSLKQDIDMLICLNSETYTLHKDRLRKENIVIYDSEDFQIPEDHIKISVPFRTILQELKGQVVMKNTIALGASLALLGADMTILNKLLEEQFGKKGESVIFFNKQFAQAGYDHIQKNFKQNIQTLLSKRENPEQLVITGNETFSLAASIADCKMYVAYPMTPASSVLSVLAGWEKHTEMVVRHAEDEISVINTAIGASIAGVRSAVGTSGGGFALMVEAVSFAGIAEVPLVIFLSQRPGPATGMPTWTEQGDLLFAVHAGHGEFPKIVLAAGDNDEMLDLTIKAFDLADIYQTPVIILSDMLLSESHRSLSKELVMKHIQNYEADRGKLIYEPDKKPYYRYQITDDGISPRLVPGAGAVYYQANSYEHLEDGHTTEESIQRINQSKKRSRKTQTYLDKHFEGPRIFGNIDEADVVLVSWGLTRGACLEAIRDLSEKGKKASLIHFTHLYPLKKESIQPYFNKSKRYVLVENNESAQFGKLLRGETGIDLTETILKFDGRPIFSDDITRVILK